MAPPSVDAKNPLHRAVRAGIHESNPLLYFDVPFDDEDLAREMTEALRPTAIPNMFRRAFVHLDSSTASTIVGFIERRGFAVTRHVYHLLGAELAKLQTARLQEFRQLSPCSPRTLRPPSGRSSGKVQLSERLMKAAEVRIADGWAIPCSVTTGRNHYRAEITGRAYGPTSPHVYLRRLTDGELTHYGVSFDLVRLDAKESRLLEGIARDLDRRFLESARAGGRP